MASANVLANDDVCDAVQSNQHDDVVGDIDFIINNKIIINNDISSFIDDFVVVWSTSEQ